MAGVQGAIPAKLRPLLNSTPPPGYVAGLGRGATGFTTRSDIGPATAGLGAEDPAPGTLPQEEDDGGVGGAGGKREEEDYSDAKFDSWGGFAENLFRGVAWDGDDDDADRVYRGVDAHMDARRKRRREAGQRESTEQRHREQPKVSTQFADLKKSLTSLSEDDWGKIPDAEDYSVRKKKRDIWMPVPDSLLLGQMGLGTSSSLDPRQMRYAHGGMDTPSGVTPITPLHGGMTPLPGMLTPMGGATPVTDLRSLGEARGTMLQVKLKQISDSVTGQTVVDPKGYMTALRGQRINSEAEVSDIKRARNLYRWVVKTNPKHGPGWTAFARLEQHAGNAAEARRIIAEGCENAPESEETWIEAVRMATPANAKVVVCKAVDKLPGSVKLWTEAARLETDPKQRKKVLRKALELIPKSVRLWKEAIELEEPEDAKVLLSRAVQVVNSIDLWLALAKLETYANAKKVLNDAREQNPTEAIIWITGAQLEEAAGNKDGMDRIIRKAVRTLAPHCTREMWVKEAEKAERAEHHLTSQSIIMSAAGLELGGDDRSKKHTWLDDAARCIDNKSYRTARAIYEYALAQFPAEEGLWIRAAELERGHGSPDELDALLKAAVRQCPHAEYLWLMAAKEKWRPGGRADGGDVHGARTVLAEAFSHNPNSEAIWVAATKLEAETGQLERAGQILAKARQRCSTPRIWLKSAKLERQLGRRQQERDTLGEAVSKWPQEEKLWLMLLQWEEWRAARIDVASLPPEEKEKERRQVRQLYAKAVKSCRASVPLWLAASRMEERVCRDEVKARSLLEKARLAVPAADPRTPALWVASVRLEERQGRRGMAEQHLSKALQQCPGSGAVWCEAVDMEPAPSRKAKALQALKRCERDGPVACAVARVLWADRKIDGARKMFDRAVRLDRDHGDAWAFFYKFEAQHGTEEQRAAVAARCAGRPEKGEAGPRRGERWLAVAKHPGNDTVGGCRLSVAETLREVAAGLGSDGG